MILKKQIKAIGLCSGGLDSIISGLIMQSQAYIEWISFETPFFMADKALKASQKYNIKLTVQNITQTYLKMLDNPDIKYGQNMNPCMDCHSLMLNLAGKFMIENNFDFIFTGDVLGQRPMSQNKHSFRYIDKKSGFDGLILRPLSAKLLEISIPEKENLINREFLHNISGRSRKAQVLLAKEFNVLDYPSPGGGCLLTDPNYSKRLKDLLYYYKNVQNKSISDIPEIEFYLLRYGRHLRLSDKAKLIIGRDQTDNENILKFFNNFQNCKSPENTVIMLKDLPGPLCLLVSYEQDKEKARELINLSVSICLKYSKISKVSQYDQENQDKSNNYVDILIKKLDNYEYIRSFFYGNL